MNSWDKMTDRERSIFIRGLWTGIRIAAGGCFETDAAVEAFIDELRERLKEEPLDGEDSEDSE